ncbi:MAG: VOC family protein [Chitinophagaceae bacterium]|nr:VOC family protein [Anaerolineae bacterium]
MKATQTGIPDGYHTTTPYLIVKDADLALNFYQKAFGAIELRRSIDSGGIVRNVQIKIGDSPVMLGIRAEDSAVQEQKVGDLPRVSIYLFVEDADQVFQQAVGEGATSLYAPEDQDYGNREGGLVDPFGITWWIATALN